MNRHIVDIKLKPISDKKVINKRIEKAIKGMSNVIGQVAAIRLFDPDSDMDYQSLKKILSHKLVKIWMDDTEKISKSDYREWAGNETNKSFLFAVHDTRLLRTKEITKVRGFVNFYFERSEKYRLKRLQKVKLLEKPAKYYLEVSMALLIDGQKALSSGLMSSALRQSCLQVRSMLNCRKQSDIVVFGFVDPKNISSIRSMEASGFVSKGKTKYDNDSIDESLLYVIDWSKLHKKINGSLLKVFENKIKIIQEPQKTDSHCAPAVTEALLGYNKVIVTQDQVVEAARVKSRLIKHGMRPKDIALAVSKLAPHLQFLYKNEATSRDLVQLVKKHHLPVGVNWQGLFYDSAAEEKRLDPVDKRGEHGHLSIIIDFEAKKDEITIDDPYSEYYNAPRIYSYRWFKTRWWDKDYEKGSVTKTYKFIFVVVPKDFTLPDSLGLKKYDN